MARSLNSVQLIGNLTRDPELRYTPNGTAVVTLGIATNRSWTTDSGEKKEEVEYHRVVAWNKLAELCSQLLSKGAKVYVHGRLTTRSWTGQDGAQKSTTEIIIDDMMVLSGKKEGADFGGGSYTPTQKPAQTKKEASPLAKQSEAAGEPKEEVQKHPEEDVPQNLTDDVAPDDIPF